MPEDSLAKTHLVDSLYHALRSTGYGQLRHIGVDYHDGCIYLRGRVPTDFHKQIAQALAASFPQVQRIENEIEVVSHH